MAVVQPIFTAVAGDTTTQIVPTCQDAYTKAVIDLTGATVSFRYKYKGGTLVVRTMVVTAPATGVAKYQFITSELVVGWITGEVEVVAGGKTNISKRFYINVVARVA